MPSGCAPRAPYSTCGPLTSTTHATQALSSNPSLGLHGPPGPHTSCQLSGHRGSALRSHGCPQGANSAARAYTDMRDELSRQSLRQAGDRGLALLQQNPAREDGGCVPLGGAPKRQSALCCWGSRGKPGDSRRRCLTRVQKGITQKSAF